MTIAIILAGGSGVRMGAEIPKQFIEINGKPILAYTLERFEKHPQIDAIEVVCIQGWEEQVREYSYKYGITKLKSVVTGGRSALESIRIGVDNLNATDQDIIIIHDGVRPLVDERTISNVISDCGQYGGAIAAIPLIEHIFYKGESRTDLHYIPRENAFRTVTPQAYRLSKIKSAFKKSEETGAGKDAPFIGILMMDVGEEVCLSQSSEKNVKITDPKDITYLKAEFE